MSLSPNNLPLNDSLRERVEKDFAPDYEVSGEVLSHDDIVGFLAKSKDTDGSPLATIRRRAAKINRKAQLAPEDHALLDWISEAFGDWEDQFPLETPLCDHVARLQPLAVAIALEDDSFFEAGNHSFHKLLDALQQGAVGWQARLDRAGQMLEQRIERAVDKALEWFRDDRTDISAITRELESANERDAARAERMVQRLAETEEARLKTLSAKRDAALVINQGLDEYLLPAAIGDFVKGAWYDSAQLILVKHGNKSREWEQMSRTTEHLMQSVQVIENNEAEKDRQAQILRHLPGQLRKWLISLEHDSDGTDSAIGLVEYAHLRLQHGQSLDLARVSPLELDDDDLSNGESGADYRDGDWYRFEDDEGELRAQLVLQLEDGQHLLFANFVGLKAIDLSRRAFQQRLEDGFAFELPNRKSFSLSLLSATGIRTEEQLKQFLDPSYVPPKPEPEAVADTELEAQGKSEDLTDELELDPLEEDLAVDSTNDPDEVLELTLDEEFKSQTVAGDEPSAEDSDHYDPVLTPPEGAEVDLGFEAAEPSANSVSSPAGGAAAEAPTPAVTPAPEATPAPYAPEPSPAPVTPDPIPTVTPPPAQPPTPAVTATSTPVQPEAPPLAASPTATPAPRPTPMAPQAPSQEPTQVSVPAPVPTPGPGPGQQDSVAPPATPYHQGDWTQQAPAQNPGFTPSQPTPAATPTPAPPPTPSPTSAASTTLVSTTGSGDTREVDVPMGAWLGFHDGETPIMAKLAVFDPRRDNYIFVNRKGIALRELNRAELLSLIDRGLVDILETRCYFRDEVERARGEDS
ncbi:MAG: DUF1631 family protein [Pseudomonadota bacterium]